MAAAKRSDDLEQQVDGMEHAHGKDIPFRGLAFVAAACRYKNFTQTSQFLHVTPSAVSKQIAQIEARLGVILFERNANVLEPTEAALTLSDAFNKASGMLTATISELRPEAASRSLRVAAPTSYAMRWLMPRLWDFSRQHQDIRIDVVPTHASTPLSSIDFDVAIRQVTRNTAPRDSVQLFSERLGLLAHPSLFRRRSGARARSLADITLIESESRPGELDAWTARVAGKVRLSRERRRYPHFYIALEAAVAGQGAMIGPLITLSDMLTRGQLTEPLPELRISGDDIVAISGKGRSGLADSKAFVEWLVGQCRDPRLLTATDN